MLAHLKRLVLTKYLCCLCIYSKDLNNFASNVLQLHVGHLLWTSHFQMFIITTLRSRALLCLPGKAGKEMTINRVCETFFAFCKWLFFKYFPFTVCICPGSGACTTVLCLLVLSCSLSPIGPSDSLSPYFCRNTNITVEKGQNNRYITVAKYMAKELIFLAFELALDTWIRSQLSAE